MNRSAFTLVELLVVISIIAILAAILLPVTGKVSAQADNTKCVSNMRQLGLAMNLYANDNDNRLPGPVGGGVGRALVNTDTRQFVYLLQPYLGLSKPTATAIYPEIMRCPAIKGEALAGQPNWYDVTSMTSMGYAGLPPSKTYLPAVNVTDSNGTVWPVGPWGRSNSTPAIPGLKILQLPTAIDLTKTTPAGNSPTLADVPALREINGISTEYQKTSWPWPVPPKPVHGNHINVLYFDWHVGAVDPLYYTQ